MRVTIERADLLRTLTHVQSVVERRNTIPILSNLLIKADGAGVQLSATDLDIEVVETSSAEIAQPGATTAPAHMMYDIVRKLPDGAQLEITQGPDENRLAHICRTLALFSCSFAGRRFPRSWRPAT